MEKKVRKNKELTVGVALVSLFCGHRRICAEGAEYGSVRTTRRKRRGRRRRRLPYAEADLY